MDEWVAGLSHETTTHDQEGSWANSTTGPLLLGTAILTAHVSRSHLSTFALGLSRHMAWFCSILVSYMQFSVTVIWLACSLGERL